MTPVRNKALEIQAWCARLGVPMLGNDLMIGDYIDARWPSLNRSTRKAILVAALGLAALNKPVASKP